MVLLSIRRKGDFDDFGRKNDHFQPFLAQNVHLTPPLNFFKFPLMYDIVHFVKKPKLGLWFCYELEEVRL